MVFGEERSQVDSAIVCISWGRFTRGGQQSEMEETQERSDLRWRGAITGGLQQSQVEGRDLMCMEAISGGGVRLQLERSVRRHKVYKSDRRWKGALSGGV